VSRRSTTLHRDAALAAIESLPDSHAVAKRLGVTNRTVQRWAKDRLIPSIKFGSRCTRFRWPDVEAIANRLTIREVA
jgi:excisionase family DNA binding protein